MREKFLKTGVEFKKGSYTFQNDLEMFILLVVLRKAVCNLAESFETNPSIDATFTDAITEPNKFK